MLDYLKHICGRIGTDVVSRWGSFYSPLLKVVLLLLGAVVVWVLFKRLFKRDRKRFSEMMDRLPIDEALEYKTASGEDNSIGGEYDDASYQDEMRHIRRESDVQSLSHRVTILFILVPSLLCVIMAFAYLDIRQRLNEMDSARSENVQALSEEVVNKVASLSDKYAELEKSLVARLTALERYTSSINEGLKRNHGEIKMLVTSKADKEVLERNEKRRLQETERIFSKLQKDLAEQRASLEELTKGVMSQLDERASAIQVLRDDIRAQKKEMTEIMHVMDSVRARTEKQESLMRDLAERKANKEEFENRIESERAIFQVRAVLLEKKVRSLENKMLRLGEQVGLALENGGTESHPPQEESMHGTTKGSPAPAPGKIVEQDITE